MKIKKIILNNFRAYKHTKFELDDFSCIIGKNDVGKSTIFAALDWFFGNIELSDSDFNVDQLEMYRDDTISHQGKFELSVEIDIDTTQDVVPTIRTNSIKQFICTDFIDNDIMHIKKIQRHSESLSYNENEKSWYEVKTYYFEKIGKPFSVLDENALKNEYVKIGKDINSLLVKIKNDKHNLKNANNDLLWKILADEFYENENGRIISNEICRCLSEYYTKLNDNRRCYLMPIKDKDDIEEFLSFCPHFKLFRFDMSINEYLKLLLNAIPLEIREKVKNIKKAIAQQISEKVFSNTETPKEEFDFSESFDILANSILLTKENIPLKNRGDGFQLKVKNAIFRILADQAYTDSRSFIYAFEEPETHLHPREQVAMYQTLKQLSNKPNYQIMITTHSPYIVKELGNDNVSDIKIIKKDGNRVDIDTMGEKIINYGSDSDYISLNEINYRAFGEASIEYHIELFGYIHERLKERHSSDSTFEHIWNNKLQKYDKDGKLIDVDSSHDGSSINDIAAVDAWLVNASKELINSYKLT